MNIINLLLALALTFAPQEYPGLPPTNRTAAKTHCGQAPDGYHREYDQECLESAYGKKAAHEHKHKWHGAALAHNSIIDEADRMEREADAELIELQADLAHWMGVLNNPNTTPAERAYAQGQVDAINGQISAAYQKKANAAAIRRAARDAWPRTMGNIDGDYYLSIRDCCRLVAD
jgi:hypothetical protein